MKRWIGVALGTFAACLAFAAWAQMGMMRGPGMMGGGMGGGSAASMARHRFAMGGGIEPAYAGTTDPLPDTAAVRAEGRKVFEQTCAVCHGQGGQGDGPAGKGLNPPAANIAFFVHRPFASDAYLNWTINEGGKRFGTAMPAYKGVLTQEQIWQVIRYLRTL